MQINWTHKSFEELTIHELYALLALRTEIFVVEQDCPYQECDGKDQLGIHLLGYIDKELVAYLRILPANVSYETPSIGRVVTSDKIRGKGFGQELMQQGIDVLINAYGNSQITISAQEHLEKYYGKLGFAKASEMYLEDDIPHIKMIREA